MKFCSSCSGAPLGTGGIPAAPAGGYWVPAVSSTKVAPPGVYPFAYYVGGNRARLHANKKTSWRAVLDTRQGGPTGLEIRLHLVPTGPDDATIGASGDRDSMDTAQMMQWAGTGKAPTMTLKRGDPVDARGASALGRLNASVSGTGASSFKPMSLTAAAQSDAARQVSNAQYTWNARPGTGGAEIDVAPTALLFREAFPGLSVRDIATMTAIALAGDPEDPRFDRAYQAALRGLG